MGRSVLGPADVSDEELTAMVADSLGVPDVEIVDCQAEVAAYDIEALTTAARYWVRGTARHAAGSSPFAFYVKVVQSWTRSPVFQHVPEPLGEAAAASLPWQNEPLVYRSDLGHRLPDGLSLPRVHAVLDLDELSAAIWLQAVDVDPAPWPPSRFDRAAYLLGRLAASPRVAPLRAIGSHDVVRGYAGSRVEQQILPTLRSTELWRHPLVADSFSAELRDRLLAAVDFLPELVAELDGAPLGTAHGDACPRNLLVPRGSAEEFVLIDFGLWSEAPLGFDLSQLLLGEMQLGERPATEVAALEERCLNAYVQGLHDEGCDVAFDAVRRAHALLMLLFWGLSSVPLEVAFGLPLPGSVAVRERAQAAAFVLDLVDATRPA